MLKMLIKSVKLCVLVYASLLFSCQSHVPPHGTDRWSSFPERDEAWKPLEERFYFSEVWTWNYRNTGMPNADFPSSGKVKMYLDPVSGTMLFTRNDAQTNNPEVDFVMAVADQYFVGFTRADGSREMEGHELGSAIFVDPVIQENFDQRVIVTERSKKYGKGRLSFKGHAYEIRHPEPNATHEVFLAEVPFNFGALYQLNKINPDFRFPFDLPYHDLLPSKYLLLEQKMQIGSRTTELVLEKVEGAAYPFDFEVYRKER